MATARPVLSRVAVPCQNREALLQAYTAALHSHHADVLFHAALLGTKTASGIVIVAEYRVEESRQAFIAAREAYVAHLLEHTCDHLVAASGLQHAANCVTIASSLHDQGETLDTTITDARHSATQYETTTNNLLNKISTVLAQK